MCCIQVLLAFARLANIISPTAASSSDNSITSLIHTTQAQRLSGYTSVLNPILPPTETFPMYLNSLQAKFEALLDAKFREFERRSLSPFFAACHQVEERWSRIESALDGHQEDLQVESVASEAYSSSTERSSVSQDPSSSPIVEPRSPASIGQRPGSFPAFDVSSPTTSNFSATPSELAEAIGVSTKDCNEYALAHFEDVYKAEEDIRSITAKALPKDSKIPAKTAPSVIKAPVNTVRKEIQPPVNNNPWTTVSRWHSKPVDSNTKATSSFRLLSRELPFSRMWWKAVAVAFKSSRTSFVSRRKTTSSSKSIPMVWPSVRLILDRVIGITWVSLGPFLWLADQLTPSLVASQSRLRQSALRTRPQLLYVSPACLVLFTDKIHNLSSSAQ